jgi:hypothetical protein
MSRVLIKGWRDLYMKEINGLCLFSLHFDLGIFFNLIFLYVDDDGGVESEVEEDIVNLGVSGFVFRR